MVRTHFVRRSSNSKIGPMAATYRDRGSCPLACPLLVKGCYAAGRIDGIPKKHGTEESNAWVQPATQLPDGSWIRHLVVGDLLTDAKKIDWRFIRGIDRLAALRPDVTQFLYTHTHAEKAIRAWMRRTKAVVNASCETEAQALKASRLGLLPVITLIDQNDPLVGTKIDGRKVIVCPAEDSRHKGNVTCASCGLCGKRDKGTWKRPIIGFPAHSVAWKAVATATGRAA
jgi:hypothetical protein